MCVLFTNNIWIHQCSLYVCSFCKPLMDPPVFIVCVFFSTNHIWINQWSLHVCSFPKSHIDPLESLLVCSYTKTSTRVIACVFFSQTTYGSTSVHSMCVIFQKPHMDQPVIIACVFFSQITDGPTRVIACVFLYKN